MSPFESAEPDRALNATWTTSLPVWAGTLVQIGLEMHSRAAGGDTRIALCATLPTGAMAAAFVSLGAAISSFSTSLPRSLEDHFERLGATPPDTPVTVRKHDELRSGWLVGPRTVMGNECIAYVERTHGGSEMRYLFKDRCLDIQPMPAGSEPFVHAQAPFVGPDSSELLERILPGGATLAATQFGDGVAVVTVATRFESDLMEPVAIGDSEVPLIDLVRPDRGSGSGVASRTRIIPSSSGSLDLSANEPEIVVFDGPQGYLRLRDEFEGAALILLLDRWDSGAESAARAFIADYAPYGDRIDPPGGQQLAGVELLAYAVDR